MLAISRKYTLNLKTCYQKKNVIIYYGLQIDIVFCMH